MNQNRLSRAQSGLFDQRLPGCRCREWDGRSLFKIDRPGLERRMILVRDRKLSIPALLFKTEIGVDGVAWFKLRDFVSNLFYCARHIHTGDERKSGNPAFANENVNRINPRRHHPNKNLILFRLRSRRIFILQYFRAARFMKDYCLHRRWLSCSRQWKSRN